MWSNPTYRGLTQGLIDAAHSEVRAKAWTLREMADAAWLLPDTYPIKAEFNADVNNSIADWNQKYTNNPNASPLRITPDSIIYPVNGGSMNGVAPWQHDFFTWSAGHAADLGFTGAAALRDWLAGFEIGLMTDWQNNPSQGYCWLEASAYKIQVKDASGNALTSFTQVYQATFPTLSGLTCNSPAMVAAMALLQGQSWQSGEMSGYPNSATGFPANLQIGLAATADTGLPNAQEAWDIFNSRIVQPTGDTGYKNFPNFAVLPRNVVAGPVPPPTMPTTTNSPPSTTGNTPPVPTERPAFKCTSSQCGGAIQSSGAPSRSVVSTSPTQQPTAPNITPSGSNSIALKTIANSKTASAAPESVSPARFVVSVLCTRFDAWCSRYLPKRLYVPVHETVRAQPAAEAAVPVQIRAASPVAPGLTPRVSTTNVPARRIATHAMRR
jgi:hypothetical protein